MRGQRVSSPRLGNRVRSEAARTVAKPPQVPASTRVQVYVHHVPTSGIRKAIELDAG